MSPTPDTVTTRDRKLILAACVLVARADGGLAESERAELERLATAWFPDEDAVLAVEKLCHHELSPDEIVAGLSGGAARESLWMCLSTISAIDANVPAPEQAVIDRFSKLLDRGAGRAGDRSDGPGPAARQGESREQAAERTVLWFSVYSAVVGAMPQPFFSDFSLILPAQIWMLRRIGAHYDVAFDSKMIAEFAGIAMLSAGAETLRHALSRFVPILPRAATEAASQFAVTYGLGRLAIAYFDGGRKVDAEVLRRVYADARRRGAEIYSRFATMFAGRSEKDVDGIVSDILRGT
ncbi:MAG: hypothetical protein HYR85_27745 [Planctomycetes bacterium]|nr:hypothetical protein [Planctomycetota bacterium]MBI3844225.1 hypothetical protein [Planctomycetota bacterium]